MGEETRPSGINIVGDIPWGTHLCQFYQTKEDLLDILVPYFKAGLENNEFCMWIIAEPFKGQEAEEALRKAVPDFDRYLTKGQIEILPHDKWYLKDGVFNSDRVLNGWHDKLNQALAKGYDGLRLTGNTFWLGKKDWKSFADYEAVVNNVIANYRMIAICSYCLDKCDAPELIDVVTNHQFCVIRRGGEWKIIEGGERKRMERELRQSGERYQTMLRTVMDGFWIVNAQGRFLEVNDAYCHLTGYSRQELLFMSIPDVEASERPEETARHVQRVIQNGADRFETRHRCKDGRIVHLEVSVNYSSSEGGQLYVFFQDITERKKAEEELVRVNRSLRAISECSQAMVRATDEQALLKDVCRIICDVAGYRMAWVGVAEQDDAKSIRPLAWGGAEDGYLANAAITWADTERGRGPTGLAVRSGKTHFFQDFVIEPTAAPWREAALAQGYRSSIAMPLSDTDGNVFGVFSLYAGQPNSFTPAEVELLEKLAVDLAFGISVLRDRVKRKQAEEELRETRDYLENLLNYANAPIIVWNPEFRITRFNHAFERLTWLKAEDVLSKKLDILFPQDRREESMAHIRRAVAGERWEAVEIPILRTDGSVRTVLWNSATLYDPYDETVVAMIAQGQDITERKQAEEELQETRDYLENLLNYANAPIIVWDPEFRINRFNHAFERLTWLKAEDVLSKKLDILFPQDRREESMAHIRRAVAGERWEVVEIPILRTDGSVRTVLWNSATLYDPYNETVVATIAQGQDITERKQAEEALKHKTDELARSNAELEQFAYVASHDLQEPLRMVSSYVKLLAKRYKGKLDQDADEFIDYAHDGAVRMQRLINDLLAYSRVGTRGKKFGEVNLETVLAEALSNLKMSIKENGAVITHDPLSSAYGDGGQLTQVFQNLIDNAIKFHGEEPPRIHISAKVGENEYVFSVRDNGIGIAPEYFDKVFALFQRLHTRKEYPGTGFGLAICKRIVERHNGTIWVESRPGTGSTFYFAIPKTMRKE